MMSDNKNESIKLLHFSDLHFGLNQLDWMWPTFKTQLFDDLRNLHDRTGPWDLVIFSGDLTQRASAAEFEKLTEVLKDIWGALKSFGSTPSLLVVPGNHDLTRPSEIDPVALVLTRWWSDERVQEDFWRSDTSPYRQAIKTWFQNFEDWHADLAKSIPVLPTSKGILPGDVSAIFEKGTLSLGIVGLNSSWLQHAAGDFEGLLCVHPQQLIATTEHDPDAWCGKHRFNLLVTHHPSEWLHPNALKNWSSEINPPGRFDAHLFGHMHEGRSTSVSVSGGTGRLSIQAASLFGLEKFGTNQVRRDHGYSVIHLPAVNGSRVLRIWPRKLVQRADGSRKLCANQDWNLSDDTYCDLVIDDGRTNAIVSNASQIVDDPLLPGGLAVMDVLARLIRPSSFVPAHKAVRKAEQAVFLAALQEKRAAWLVTDWGQGGNEFIDCVQQQLLGRKGEAYYLDLHQYRTQDEMLAGVPEKLGCSFERLCRDLAETGPALLVLDDVDVEGSLGLDGGGEAIASQIHAFVQVILDFCPDLRVVVRSRVSPIATPMRVVELFPLDEADTGQYVLAHERGGAQLFGHDAVARIHRHTDGIPYRVDSALRDLQIVGLKGLHELDSDVAGKLATKREIALPLIRAIQDLADSEDDACTRAFSLLKVLSLFPQGEQLARIKRFFGASAFYPNHVSMLLDRALIDAVDVASLGVSHSLSDEGKALVVRRPVREYIIQALSATEHRTLSAKALSLYFGDDWEIRGIRPPAYLKFSDSRCEAREMGNATTMVLKAANTATDAGDIRAMRSSLALATSYAAKLNSGGHFRNVASLYDDLLPFFENRPEEIDLALAREQYAESLRMIGELERARDLFKRCELSATNKSRKQSVLLSLALCCEKLDDDPTAAVEIAKRCERIDPKSNSGLHARSIIIANDPAHEHDRDSKLASLQAKARKRKSFVVANNIALDRAATTKDFTKRKQLLKEVASTARSENDAYNLIRGSLKLADLSLKEFGSITQDQLLDCSRAYNYLYNQRIDSLFNECHGILWRSFSASNDIGNLLNLYRHSSLIWRLRGKERREKEYAEKLLPLIGKRANEGVLGAGRELLYYMTRSLQLAPSPVTMTITNSSSSESD